MALAVLDTCRMCRQRPLAAKSGSRSSALIVADEPAGLGEPRWPIVLAVAIYTAMTIVLRVIEPHRESLGPPWLVPGIEISMLTVLALADPARIGTRARWMRGFSIALILSLLAVALLSSVVLITELVRGAR